MVNFIDEVMRFPYSITFKICCLGKGGKKKEESIQLAESADDIDIEAIEEKVLKKRWL